MEKRFQNAGSRTPAIIMIIVYLVLRNDVVDMEGRVESDPGGVDTQMKVVYLVAVISDPR